MFRKQILAQVKPDRVAMFIGEYRRINHFGWVAAAFLLVSWASSSLAAEAERDVSRANKGANDSRIVIAGNRATNPIMEAWMNAFSLHQKDITFEVRTDTKVSTEAFNQAIADSSIDLIPAARELVPSETERLTEQFGDAPLVLAVATGSFATKSATHALGIYVNAANPIQQISIDQLRHVYGPTPGTAVWGDLGLTGDWAKQPIVAYAVPISDPNGNPLGITNFLRNRLFGGQQGMRRSIYQIDSTGPNIDQHMLTNIVRYVASNKYSIGYSGFAFATSGVRALPVAESEAGPWIEGTLETVRDRSYPLTRTIYIALNQPSSHPIRTPLKEFLQFVLSAEGQAVLEGGDYAYLPLTENTLSVERLKIQ